MNDKVITFTLIISFVIIGFTLIISFVIIGYVIVIKDNPLDNFDKHQCYVLQDRAVEYKDFLYSVKVTNSKFGISLVSKLLKSFRLKASVN